jgi:hypothetical protein
LLQVKVSVYFILYLEVFGLGRLPLHSQGEKRDKKKKTGAARRLLGLAEGGGGRRAKTTEGWEEEVKRMKAN